MVISSHPTRSDGTSAAVHSCRIYQQTSRHPLLAPPVTNGIQKISQSEAPDWLRDRFSLPHTPGCHRSRGYTGKDPGRNKQTTDGLLVPLYMTKLCAWEGQTIHCKRTQQPTRGHRVARIPCRDWLQGLFVLQHPFLHEMKSAYLAQSMYHHQHADSLALGSPSATLADSRQ
ncbi:uncharacterized protein BO88DRAFT_271978 [Aspergillus vadensis CBS 113365]|uniref:Uncharacterized protein n=1 Tax=Aspergillus vadensis (strain CBS 113365 / IMI 142717 / IBT 24658) TaxID=1448311 RepID=A0A319BDD2_ASPVC|nr:hypothetical protein BO88DRAFT_271978 [Aspergillus vadensis CBS 113365]PYH69974.1 hypothetical protein BO88DRAFT_271978 [Aspergillus vadensis CBS 113365]